LPSSDQFAGSSFGEGTVDDDFFAADKGRDVALRSLDATPGACREVSDLFGIDAGRAAV
jgi:hypothetical protein